MSSDPTFRVCRILLTRCAWTPSKIASRLGVPAVAVEECLRSGNSSALLKRQLISLVREGGEVPHEVPSSLLAQLLSDEGDDVDQDFAAQFDTVESSSSGEPQTAAGSGGNVQTFAFLDDTTRDHFRYLQQSVGHNLFSIVNDPTEQAGAATQGGWGWNPFGAKDKKDGHPQGPPGGGAGSMGDIGGMGINVGIGAEVFSPYIGQVAPLHGNNQKLVAKDALRAERAERALKSATRRRPKDGADAPLGADGEALDESLESRGGEGESEDYVFPNSVPLRFAAKDYKVTEVFDTLRDDLSNLDGLLEQLESYQSNVEFVLMMEVQTKSEDFFNASQSFSRLHSDVEKARSGLSLTRGEVALRGESITRGFLSIARRYREKEHHRLVIQHVLTLDIVQSAVVRATSYVRRRQYEKAVGLIDSALNSSTQLSDLTIARSFPAQLALLKKQLHDGVTQELKTALHPSSWTVQPVATPKKAAGGGNRGQDWDRIDELLKAANQLQGCVAASLQGYTRSVSQHVAVVMDRAVRNCLEENHKLQDGRGSVNVLSDDLYRVHIPRLDVKFFLGPLLTTAESTLATHVECCLTHLHAVEVSVTLEPTWVAQHKYELHTAVQACLCKLLEARTMATAGGGVEPFRQHHMELLMKSAFSFIHTMEMVLGVASTETASPTATSEAEASGGTVTTPAQKLAAMGKYRVSLLNQARHFIKKKHSQKQELLQAMLTGQENWAQQEGIDHSFQSYVHQLCEFDSDSIQTCRSMAVDSYGEEEGEVVGPLSGRKWGIDGAQGSPTSDSVASLLKHSGESTSNNASLAGNSTQMRLTLCGPKSREGYAVVDTVLAMVHTLAEYDHYLCTFPFLSNDILPYFQEALNTFDGHCVASVLGGGAVAREILTTITPTHLAIASQCSSFLEDLMPFLRRRLNALCSEHKSVFMSSFEKIEKDLAEHRDQFLGKIVNIFHQKVAGIRLEPSQWDNDGQGKRWILLLVKEIFKLIKLVKPILSTIAYNSILWPSIAVCCHLLKAALMEAGKHSLAQWEDVQVFKMNIEKQGFCISDCTEFPGTREAYAESTARTLGGTIEIKNADPLDVVQKFFGFPKMD